jgi:5-methylthioadenosine/S-adenosylhomocysteine deaminase
MADVTASETCDLLLTGGSVVTVDEDRRVVEPGAVAIAGDRVAAVGPAADLAGIGATRTIDCTGCAVIPGFIDCHDHVVAPIVRGLWDRTAPGPRPVAPPRIDVGVERDEALAAAARLGALEAAKAGTTSVVCLHDGVDLGSTLAVAAAIEEVGLRGVVALRMTGDVGEIAIVRAAIEARRGSRVEVWPAPLVFGPEEALRAAASLARELGAGWQPNACGPGAGPTTPRSEGWMGPVEWLDGEGLLGPSTTLAGATSLEDRAVERLGASRTGVVYSPVSDQRSGRGVLPLRMLRDAGAVVGLGHGGAGGRHDMFEQMKQAILLQRVDSLDPTISVAEEAFELATTEGARMIASEAGSLAPGRLADVTVVRLGRAHTTPWHRTVAALVYSARPADVEIAIVGGEIVVEDGRSTKVDEAAVIADATRAAGTLASRAGLEPPLAPGLPPRLRRDERAQPSNDPEGPRAHAGPGRPREMT